MSISSVNAAAGIRTLSDLNASQAAVDKSDGMGADAFLTLLTTQLQNQDPLSPMENAEFLSQLAQMSTVQGIDDLNSTMGTIASQMNGSRISEASSMLGQRALVPGSTVHASEGRVDGRIYLDQNASSVTVNYADATTGQILHTQTLNEQVSGAVEFNWDEAPADGRQIRVSATVAGANGTHDASTSVYARIEGVEVSPTGGNMTLQVRGYGFYMGSEITALRK